MERCNLGFSGSFFCELECKVLDYASFDRDRAILFFMMSKCHFTDITYYFQRTSVIYLLFVVSLKVHMLLIFFISPSQSITIYYFSLLVVGHPQNQDSSGNIESCILIMFQICVKYIPQMTKVPLIRRGKRLDLSSTSCWN